MGIDITELRERIASFDQHDPTEDHTFTAEVVNDLLDLLDQARDYAVRYRDSYARARAGGVSGLTNDEFHHLVNEMRRHHPIPWAL